MPNVVNVDGLTRASRVYNNVLRELPYFMLNQTCKNLRINIIAVKGEDILISKRRKAGLLRPYKPGLTLGNNPELMKFYEAKLKPEETYAEVNDNILNYKEKKIISNQGEMIDNKSKKHPLELMILTDVVKSVSEDVIFALFFAERDDDVASPSTAFTGFFSKIDLLTVAGEISEENGNLKTTGEFKLPVHGADYTSYKKLVEFVKSAHPLLKQGEVLLYAAENPINCARMAYWKMTKSYQYPSTEEMLTKLRSDANAPGLKLVTDIALGTGDRLLLQKPGLLDLGVNNESDKDYVQVRNPYKDPNEVQFWVQASYDTRINDVHEKLFQTNEQTNTSVNYAGDYV
ncbi:MAG: hypothetical protein LBJ72_11940 [Dysgonamonadaceae bacterium]|jgi:hypothetical protein|nr:hypothetical protein [Dysgonamonadaceae bacterium]